MKLLGHLVIALLLAASLRAEVRLVASGQIPPDTRDQLGDTVGGLGSAVSYDPRTGDILMMPDRGAGDGSIDYRPRFYRLRITRDGSKLTTKIRQTVLFRDERGKPFTGLIPSGHSDRSQDHPRSIDPEALAVAPDGTIYVSEEYAPSLLQFRRDGRLLRTIALPDWYQPRDFQNQPIAAWSKRTPKSGRDENRGPEAMGILPEGKRAVLIFQSALVQDGGKPAGTTRILLLDLTTGTPLAEYAYAFTDPRPWGPRLRFRDLSVNDLAVLDDHRLLVLERDDLGRSGPLGKEASVARYKSVWLVDLSAATNLLALPGQPYDQPPSAKAFRPLTRKSPVAFARKTLLFNLPDLTAQLGIPAETLAAKWEGLARLPSKSSGPYRLLMTADNDFLNPTLTFDGVTHRFPRARDAVPTQIFEIVADR